VLELVDLSNNNPDPLRFTAVKAHGIYGMWHKVSEGLNFTDMRFADRARSARAAGLRVGGYHYAHPAVGTATAEAEYFVDRLGSIGRRDLHPVLDLEEDGGLAAGALRDWARIFLRHVHERTGVKCLTYSSPSFISERHWTETFGTGAGLWLADYGPDDGRNHGAHIPRPWRKIVAHQYTSVGSVPGIPGHVDRSSARARRHLLAHGIRGIP
jgi:GH25 family lysozyme M1 (1,4-beta-N-acetylmuramidase)